MQRADLSESLRRVSELMRAFPAPWCVAGGWALDLFLGRVTRDHADAELAIFRNDQALLHRHLHGWTLEKVIEGRRLRWSADEQLQLPVHEIHARPFDQPDLAIEFLLNERTADEWIYRRDPRVTRPISRAILTSDVGYPILCPEIVVLYKSKFTRPKDEGDFMMVRGALDAEQRLWLRAALQTCHPEHPWLGILPR